MDTDLTALLAQAETMSAMLQEHFWLITGVSIFASLPSIFVLFSKRVSGGAKLLWFLLTGTFSWLAYIPFLLLFRNGRNDQQDRLN